MSKDSRLSKGYRKAGKEVRTRIELLVKEPTSNNVHDLRTSLRKLEVIIGLLPKKVRKSGKMKKYLASCKKLFRSTTPLRDLDIVLQNIRNNSSGNSFQPIVSKIDRERVPLLSNSIHFAKLLREIDPPRIRKSELASYEIGKHRDRVIKKLVAKLQEELPIVLGDFRKINELHDIRKDCKKLRYVLELFPSEKHNDLIGLMKNWQAMLGAIRDIDVTQQFAEEKGYVEDLEEVLLKLRISRDKMLGSFTNSAKLEKKVVSAEIS